MELHKDFIEYAECDSEVLTCETKTLLIAELMEPFSNVSENEKD